MDRSRPTQFGRAMGRLGIQMVPAYSPEARGRSERFLRSLQGRLPKELTLEGITTMDEANRFLKRYWAGFNRRFQVRAREDGSAFVPLQGVDLDNIVCLQTERSVGKAQLRELPKQEAADAGRRPAAKVRLGMV